MESRFLNVIEILNEIFMLFFYYFMFIFTSFVPDAEARYTGGYMFMNYIILVVTINIIMIVYDICVDSIR